MLLSKSVVIKKYLKGFLRYLIWFVKFHAHLVTFIVFVLTIASILYYFGELCYLEISPIFSRKYVSVEEISQFEKQQFKLGMETRALQRRVRELAVKSENGGRFLTESQVKYLISEALRLYESDKIGLRDYALESAGGSIISTPSTTPMRSPKRYVFGVISVPVYSSPRAVIQPDIHPGNCFTFEGSQGRIRIKLSNKIYVRGVTLENPASNLLTYEELLATPRSFQVIGLRDANSADGVVLGKFSYELDGPSMQYFAISAQEIFPAFEFVELFIMENCGLRGYTSVYRFRVHGEPW